MFIEKIVPERRFRIDWSHWFDSIPEITEKLRNVVTWMVKKYKLWRLT